MSFLTRLVAPACLCAFVTVSASATTYYVSQSTGSDTNNGLTQSTPFKTLAKANTLTKLKGGDSILLRRGDVWHEQLAVPSSGTSATSRFVIDAYGTGVAPIIDGADVVTGWSLISAGTYQVSRTEPSYKVFVDALYSQTVPLLQQTSVTNTINVPGSFYADADTLYVHLADGSDPAAHTIEVSGSTHKTGISASQKSYVTIQNLQIIRTSNSGVAFVLDSSNPNGTGPNQYNTLTNLTIFNTGSSSPMPYGFDGGILVRANTSAASKAVAGWQISKNTVGRVDSAPGLNYNIGGIQLRGLQGAMIQNNTVTTTNAMGIQDRPYGSGPSCGANTFDSNVLSDNEGNITANSAYDIVTNNRVTNSRGFGIQVQSYGLAENNTMAHLGLSTDGRLYNGIDGNGGDHAQYINNNITDVYACSITVEGAAVGVTISGGTYDSNNASGCATYITDTTQSVTFTGNINWVLNPKVAKPFGYLLKNTSDSAHRYSFTDFLSVIGK